MRLENLIASARASVTPYFCRTRRGAEIDLLVVWPGGARWAIEVKLERAGRGGARAAVRLALRASS